MGLREGKELTGMGVGGGMPGEVGELRRLPVFLCGDTPRVGKHGGGGVPLRLVSGDGGLQPPLGRSHPVLGGLLAELLGRGFDGALEHSLLAAESSLVSAVSV